MSNNVKIFDVKGIKMLGNFENGSIIGLDNDGLNYVFENYSINENKLQPVKNIRNSNDIENALDELGFFEPEKDIIDSAYLHVTDSCNLHCLGCYSFVESRNAQSEMDTSTIKKILVSMSSAGVKKIVISGGEPFLRDDIGEICRFIKEECEMVYLSVITNGTLSLDRYIESLVYIDELNISIDGYDKESSFIRDTGIMATVIETVKNLRDRVKINLIVTLHKKNIKYMDRYSELAKTLNVTYSYSIFTVSEDSQIFKDFLFKNEDLIEIEKRLSQLNNNVTVNDVPISEGVLYCRDRCEAGRKLISIDAKGFVYPCHMLHDKSLILGDAKKNEIREIVFSKSNPLLNNSVDDVEGCNSCDYKYLCGGGCRGRSFLKYGLFDKKDSYCALIYKFYENMIEEVKNQLG